MLKLNQEWKLYRGPWDYREGLRLEQQLFLAFILVSPPKSQVKSPLIIPYKPLNIVVHDP